MSQISSTIKYTIKLCLSFTLYYTGILNIYHRIKLRNSGVVLMYHRVIPANRWHETFSSPGIIVTNTTFSKHLKFLKSKFSILSMDEFICGLSGETANNLNNACLITFDDGWLDNYEYAFPILKKENVPATIFLPTKFISNNKLKFWQEELTKLLFILYTNNLSVPDNKLSLPDLNGLPDNLLQIAIRNYVNNLKNHSIPPYKIITDLYQYLVEQNINDNVTDIDSYIDWNQVSEMAKSGINFGSHSINHLILTKLDDKQVEYELTESQKIINDKLGCDTNSLAYPNGNYNSCAENIAKQNYKVAFSTNEGYVKSSDNRHTLKRINIHDAATRYIPMFYCRLLGVF